MEINKKLSIPELVGLFSMLCGFILYFAALSIAVKTNTENIQTNKTSISELDNRYNSTELFKSNQLLINANQEKFNLRLEQTLSESAKTNQALQQAVTKLQVFLDNNQPSHK